MPPVERKCKCGKRRYLPRRQEDKSREQAQIRCGQDQNEQTPKIMNNDIPELEADELEAVDLPDGAVLEGADMPKSSEYLSARQKNGKPLGADAIYKEIWLWLKRRQCKNLVNPRLIESYAQNFARYIQCEDAISTYGLLGKHPTTGGVVTSPFV